MVTATVKEAGYSAQASGLFFVLFSFTECSVMDFTHNILFYYYLF